MYEELLERLKEDAECAAGNEWETPVALQDHLKMAANAIEDLLSSMEQVGKKYIDVCSHARELELQLKDANEGRKFEWIDAEERLPDKPGMYLVVVHEYDGVTKEPYFSEGWDGSYIDFLEYDDRQKVWQNGQYDAYNAVLSVVNKEESYYISHWMEGPEKPSGLFESLKRGLEQAINGETRSETVVSD